MTNLTDCSAAGATEKLHRGLARTSGSRSGRFPFTSAVIALGHLYRQALAIFLNCIGPVHAYSLIARLALRFYDLAEEVRRVSEARCKRALAGLRAEREIRAISRLSFVNRMWNQVD